MNKFVLITDSNTYPEECQLRIGNVQCHFELVGNNEKCYGGGFFLIDYNKKTIKFYGKSIDYGNPQFEKFKIFYLSNEFQEFKILWLGLDISDVSKVKEQDITSKIKWV